MAGATGSWSTGATGEWEQNPDTWHPTPQSSNVGAWKYDPRSKVLTGRFKSGREYRFGDVPQDVAEGLGSASSVGKYFNSAIKNSYRTI